MPLDPPLMVPTVLPCAGTVQKEKPFYTMANQQWTRCGGCIKGRQNLVLMGKPRILSHLHQIQQKNKLKKCKPRPGKQPIQKQGSKTLIITFSFPGTFIRAYVCMSEKWQDSQPVFYNLLFVPIQLM